MRGVLIRRLAGPRPRQSPQSIESARRYRGMLTTVRCQEQARVEVKNHPADRHRCRDRRLFRLRSRALSGPGVPQGATRRHRGLQGKQPDSDGRSVLPDLCRGDRPVAAGRRGDDAGRRRDLRPAVGHGDHLVRLVHRRHAGVPRQSPAVPGERSTAFRRQAARRQRRRREGRRVLPVRAAPGADLPVLRHQPADGPDADPHLDLLLGQPGRHARRHDRLRERRHAAGQDRQRQRHPVAGDPRLLRVARGVSVHRQAGAGLDQGTQGLRPLAGQEAGRNSTTTWW